MQTYASGQTVVLSVTFVNTATGAPIAPSTVELRVISPGMTETDTTVGFVNPSTGVYTRNMVVYQAGTWTYRWLASGTFLAAGEGSFQVAQTPFLVPP